jgi:hypothetical protein
MTKEKDMVELLNIAKNIQQNAAEIIKEKIYNEIVFVIGSLLRSYYLSTGKNKNKTLHRAILNELRELDNEDFQADIVFIPTENKTLILTYLPIRSDKEEKIMSIEEKIKDYQYWNNVEPDEKVSPEEWKQREEDWKILGNDAPVNHGFNFQIFNGEHTHWVLRDEDFRIKLEKYIGSIEDMKYEIAKGYVIDKMVASMNVSDDNSTVGIARALHIARELVEKGEKEQEIQAQFNLMNNIQTVDDILSLDI